MRPVTTDLGACARCGAEGWVHVHEQGAWCNACEAQQLKHAEDVVAFKLVSVMALLACAGAALAAVMWWSP